MKYQMSQRPGSGAQRAYILGARLNSGNIGEAIVNRLYSEGWHVLGDDCLNPSLGLYVSPTVEQFEEADADALVITLGRTYNESFDSLDPNTITHALDANLTLPLEAARRYVEANKDSTRWHWEENPRRIIFIGSYGYEHPFTNGTLYCAAKAGLDAAARALGWELTDKGYRVHIVHPYHVQGTPMWGQVEQAVAERYGIDSEDAHEYTRRDLKMPDLLVASEVAEVVHALLTVPALQWTSGTGIKLYGGTR
jgi:NAD(P)-dependent dehydrogenase (short-subunit alcohol dehydrogenase family)